MRLFEIGILLYAAKSHIYQYIQMFFSFGYACLLYRHILLQTLFDLLKDESHLPLINILMGRCTHDN